MKLVHHIILITEIQDYLDKYEDKIKFIFNPKPYDVPQTVCIIIDEE